MSPTVDFELAIVGAGMLLGVVATAVGSATVGLAAMLVAILAAFAAWLDHHA